MRMRLPQDASYDLLHIRLGGLVRKRRKNVGKRTIPPFLECIDGDDVPYRTTGRKEIDLCEFILVRRLYGDLLRGDSLSNKFFPYLLERFRIIGRLRLRLKQNDWSQILRACVHRGICLDLKLPAKLDRIVYDAVSVRPVIDDDRQLDHVFLLEFPRIDVGYDVRPPGRRCRHCEHKGRIHVLEHRNAQFAFGVVALIHHHDGIELANHLQERGVGRVVAKL